MTDSLDAPPLSFAEQFPVDPLIIDMLLEVTDHAAVGVDSEGDAILPEGVSSLFGLLEFLSGYDKSQSVEVNSIMNEYDIPMFSHVDVIYSLAAEVKRLRSLLPDEQ